VLLVDFLGLAVEMVWNFTLLVPYIFNYIYVMQTNIHSIMLFNTILLNVAQNLIKLC
jgi:hypothetical protein